MNYYKVTLKFYFNGSVYYFEDMRYATAYTLTKEKIEDEFYKNSNIQIVIEETNEQGEVI